MKRIKNLTDKEYKEKSYILNQNDVITNGNLFIDTEYIDFSDILESIEKMELLIKIIQFCKFKQNYILFNIDRYEFVELCRGYYNKEQDIFYVPDKELENHF